MNVSALDTEKKWDVHITIENNQTIFPGTIFAEVQETEAILHKSMIPPNIQGRSQISCQRRIIHYR